MSGPPVRLAGEQATVLVRQFRETAGHRGWRLLAAAVMAQHVHLLVGVPDDPDPDGMLRDFKSYGSRSLNRLADVDAPLRWWTKGGSTRKKADHAAVLDAAAYVRDQEWILAGEVAPDVAEVIGPLGCDWQERERERTRGGTGGLTPPRSPRFSSTRHGSVQYVPAPSSSSISSTVRLFA